MENNGKVCISSLGGVTVPRAFPKDRALVTCSKLKSYNHDVMELYLQVAEGNVVQYKQLGRADTTILSDRYHSVDYITFGEKDHGALV